VVLAGVIVGAAKLIATGSTVGLFHGGWATALNVVGWTLIVLLALAERARERNRRIAILAAQRHEDYASDRPSDP
jgi:hypothetical protein